jgi:integrase
MFDVILGDTSPYQPSEWLQKASLSKIRIHDLRHIHASHLVSSGLSLTIVGKLLGHTQASTTQRYAHLADEPLRQAAALFGRKTRGVMDSQRALMDD